MEEVIVTAKKSNAKPVTVNEVTYGSRSESIRALLDSGMKKSEIAKAIGATYSFVQTISSRYGFDYEVIKQNGRDKKFQSTKAMEMKKVKANILKAENKIVELSNLIVEYGYKVTDLMNENDTRNKYLAENGYINGNVSEVVADK